MVCVSDLSSGLFGLFGHQVAQVCASRACYPTSVNGIAGLFRENDAALRLLDRYCDLWQLM